MADATGGDTARFSAVFSGTAMSFRNIVMSLSNGTNSFRDRTMSLPDGALPFPDRAMVFPGNAGDLSCNAGDYVLFVSLTGVFAFNTASAALAVETSAPRVFDGGKDVFSLFV